MSTTVLDVPRKSIGRVEWKAEKEGAGRAVIATLNVVDKDGDVSIPGSFPVGKEVPVSSYGHGSWGSGVDALPIGKGVIGSSGTEAWVDFELFLDTAAGREHYTAMKRLGGLVEWSYGYNPLDSSTDPSDLSLYSGAVRILKRVDVHEASPVLLGAGVNTRTENMKSVGIRYAEECETALAAVSSFVERTKSLADLRAKEGRVLSRVNLANVEAAIEALDNAATALRELRDRAAREEEDDGKSLDLATLMAVAEATVSHARTLVN